MFTGLFSATILGMIHETYERRKLRVRRNYETFPGHQNLYSPHTVRNLHFLSKNSTLISRENCRLFFCKARENVVVLNILAVDNFDFTRKIVKKNLGEKLM